MKNFLFLLLVSFPLWGLGGCNKNDDNPTNPIDLLPPATQTGEQTFGCLIDGEAFLPDNFGSGRPNAFYQLVGGKYFLGINASQKDSPLKTVGIGADDIIIQKGNTYNFTIENDDNPAFYGYYLLGGGLYADYITTIIYNGEITISNFDSENFIISGIFWFDAEEISTGKIIKITNGRFDLKYTN